MVNQSFQNLGDSLLRDRMLKQQDRHFGAGLDERAREFDISADQADRRTAVDEQRAGSDELRAQAADKNADTMALYRKAMEQNAQAKQSVEQLRNAVNDITTQHKAGQISTAEANRRVKMLQENLRRGVDFVSQESGLADINFQDIPPKPDAAPADVDKDRAAAQLEKDAATETDPAAKATMLERAKALRSGIGRQDPGAFIEETTVLERDEEGKPSRSQKRRIPAGQVNNQAAAPTPKGKPLTLQQAQEFLKQAGGDKAKARELARKSGYVF